MSESDEVILKEAEIESSQKEGIKGKEITMKLMRQQFLQRKNDDTNRYKVNLVTR
jgi:hypothetical protein